MEIINRLLKLKSNGLSGFQLKWTAAAAALIGGFGAVIMDGVCTPYLANGTLTITSALPWLIRHSPQIKAVCAALGALAFPLACFLFSEGFIHTASRLRYGLRLGLLAVVSEVPFDLAYYGSPFDFRLQNGAFTIFIAFLLLAAAEAVWNGTHGSRSIKTLLIILISALALESAYLLRCEYAFLGVAAAALLYHLRGRGPMRYIGLLPMAAATPWSLLSAVPIYLYNGRRGHGQKYLFYAAYPLYLLVFYGIALFCAGL